MAANDVNEVQAASQSLMSAQVATVNSFLNTLAGFTNVNTLTLPTVDLTSYFLNPAFADSAFSILDAARPLNTVYANVPADPAEPPTPNLNEIDTVSSDNIETFEATAPVLNLPTAPSASLPTAPNSPAIQNPGLPTMPAFSLPNAPTFQDVPMPNAMAVSIPDFSFATPISDLTAPTANFAFSEQDYTSVLSDAVKLKLLSDIENGGYGIETVDERALWDRARERTSIEANARVEEALRAAASRGFPLPPGADMAMIAEAQQAALEKISSVDREIALKRADMYVENRKFSIQAATEVESLFINYRSAMMERMLNAAKALVELGIAAFNARKDKYMADLEAYKSYAQVFEAKIRAELLKVEIFKGQVEAAKGKVDVQRGMADVYRTQVEAVNALMGVYRTQMEGTKVLMEVERNKIEAFRVQMEGYATQVQAKTAEFGLYEARIKGETAKLDVYRTQAQAYGAKVEGYKARIAAQEAVVSAQKLSNDAIIDRYRTQLDGYKSKVQLILGKMAANTEVYKADTGVYNVRSENLNRKMGLGLQIESTNFALAQRNLDREINNVQRETDALFRLMDWRLNAAKYGTDAATNMAVSAAQQITGLTSLLKEG